MVCFYDDRDGIATNVWPLTEVADQSGLSSLCQDNVSS